MFGKIISIVFSTWTPVYVKVSLSYSVPNPILSHIYRFASPLVHGFMCDPGSALGICLDQIGRLRMAEVGKDCAYGLCFIFVVEESAELCFCIGGDDVAHDGRKNKE